MELLQAFHNVYLQVGLGISLEKKYLLQNSLTSASWASLTQKNLGRDNRSKSVKFSDTIITGIWVLPQYTKEEKKLLFYSRRDINRFFEGTQNEECELR